MFDRNFLKNFHISFIWSNCLNSFSVLKAVVSICILTTSFVFSQECALTLTGKVFDVEDNLPLEAAVIEVLGSSTTTVSDATGVFQLKNQCKGKITLKISHLNCEPVFREIDLFKSSSFNFQLKHRIESLDEVIVSKLRVHELSATSKVHSLSELEKDRYSSKGLAGALEQISGVSVLSTGNSIGKPIIHGMFGSRVGVVYDGVMLENQQWGQDHAPNVDLNTFENIRLIKGSGALKYGTTPGGVVILESIHPKRVDSLYGKTILGGMYNGRGYSAISHWVKSYKSGAYVKFQGTFKKNGDFTASNYNLTNTGNKENNLSISLGKNGLQHQWKAFFSYFDTDIAILKSAHIGNVKDLLRAIESDVPLVIEPLKNDIDYPKQANNHYTANLEYTNTKVAKGELHLKYSWQRNNRKEFDIRRGELKDTPSLDMELNTHNLLSNYEWNTGLGNFDSGVLFQLQDNYSSPDTEIRRLIPDYLKTKLGGYFTAVINNTKDFIFEFGARYEYHNNVVQKFYKDSRWDLKNYEAAFRKYVIREEKSQKLVKRTLEFNTFSFNAGIRHSISPTYSVNFNYSHTQRAPNIAEMFSDGLHHSLASIEYGNPFLEKETTHKAVIDFDKRTGDFQFTLTPFVSIGNNNYIIIEPTGFESTIRGAFPVWEYTAISALFVGADLDFSYAFNANMQFRNSTSWVEATNTKTDLPLVNIPPLTINNQLQFSLPNWKSFFVLLNSKNVFRQNRYPNNNFTESVIEDGKIVSKLVDISTPPNGYHDLGLELNWGPYPLRTTKVSVSLILDNVLDASYRNYLNRLRFYSDEIGRNISLQVKLYH